MCIRDSNCEIEGGGLSSINILTSKMFYPNVWRYRQADRLPGSMTNSFGWLMNWQRKQMAIAFVIDLLGQKMLKIHDEVTYDQMANYVSLRYGCLLYTSVFILAVEAESPDRPVWIFRYGGAQKVPAGQFLTRMGRHDRMHRRGIWEDHRFHRVIEKKNGQVNGRERNGMGRR